MDLLGVDRLDICPWALREGVILRRLDQLDDRLTGARTSRPARRTAGRHGRPRPHARQRGPGARRPRRAVDGVGLPGVAAPPRSSWPRGWATTASRSWSGPTRSPRRPARCAALAELHGMPVVSVHAPTPAGHPAGLGPRPVGQARPVAASWPHDVGADTVVRPPAVPLAARLRRGLRRRGRPCASTTPASPLAVENMYPWRARSREMLAYLPHWDPVSQPYDNVTLDLSHTATAGSDALDDGRDARRPAARMCTWPTAAAPPGRAPGARARHAALRRAAGDACAAVVRGAPSSSRSAPAEPDARAARGRPRRGAGVRPAAPGGGPGLTGRWGRRRRPVTRACWPGTPECVLAAPGISLCRRTEDLGYP